MFPTWTPGQEVDAADANAIPAALDVAESWVMATVGGGVVTVPVGAPWNTFSFGVFNVGDPALHNGTDVIAGPAGERWSVEFWIRWFEVAALLSYTTLEAKQSDLADEYRSAWKLGFGTVTSVTQQYSRVRNFPSPGTPIRLSIRTPYITTAIRVDLDHTFCLVRKLV